MTDRRFTEDHEWVEIQDGVALVGITNYAQEHLGDVVFVELPEVGKKFEKGDAIGTIESVKVASEIYAPMSGEIVARNDALDVDPSLLNSAPETDGWIVRIRASSPAQQDELLSAEAYARHIA
jgi:glycine cleavage system H protein